MRERKTVDQYVIVGNYCGQWDFIEGCDTYKEAKVNLKMYRENEPAAFKIVCCRFRKDQDLYRQMFTRNYR